MKRLLILIPLLLILAACANATPEDAQRYEVHLTGEFAGQPVDVIAQLNTREPAASPTPVPSATPRPPSSTPPPTNTPRPIATDTPSVTLIAPTPDNPPDAGDLWAFDVNPAFDAAKLPVDQRQQYDWLWDALNNPRQDPSCLAAAQSGDLYLIGRTLNECVTSIMSVFRVTGDPALLETAKTWMNAALASRARLVESDPAGGVRYYYNWRWLQDPAYPGYGGDTHQMDSILSGSLLAYFTYALGQLDDPDYARYYDALINNFVWVWDARAELGPPEPILLKDLTHPYTAHLRMFHYLYLLTREARWQDKYAEYYAHLFTGDSCDPRLPTFQLRADGSYRWDHRVLCYSHDLYGWQSTLYAQATLNALIDLAAEGMISDATMQRFMLTFREHVIRPGNPPTVSGTVDGSGTGRPGNYVTGNSQLLAMWDPTGIIYAFNDAVWRSQSPVYTICTYPASRVGCRTIFEPAAQFLALVTSGAGLRPTRGAAFEAFGLPVRMQEPSATPDGYTVVEVFENGTLVWSGEYMALATAPPDETPTPTPSATSTPTLTPTEPPFATPTPEPITTPSATPTATATNTPEHGCIGVVNTGALYVRDAPRGAALGFVYQGDMLYLYAQTTHTDGSLWYRIYWDENTFGYVYAGYVATTCTPPDETPEPLTAWGVWVGPGAWKPELDTFAATMQAAERIPAAVVFGEPDAANYLYDRGWLVIARPFIGDCPYFVNMGAERSAVEWVDKALANLALVNYHWLSLSNECLFPSPEYERDWTAAAIRRAKERGVERLVPHVTGTGGPELDWVPTIMQAYEDVEGIEVCWGLNQYPFYDGVGLDVFSPQTQYTTYRLLLYEHLLPVPVCVTEFARSWGEDPPVWSEYPAYIARMDGRLLWATAWYDANPLGPWPDATLRGKVGELARVISGAIGG